MNTIVLVIALISGLATFVFILDGVRRSFTGTPAAGARVFLITTVLSIVTGIFTLWQLAQVVQQIGLP